MYMMRGFDNKILRGIKTTEDENFKKFFKIVQRAANKKGGVFFLDCGEGKGQTINDIYASDLSGWLIPFVQATEFEDEWLKGDIDEKWNEYMLFSTWKQHEDGRLIVEFVEA